MFNTIMVPVDSRHAPRLGKALTIAADLAKANDATVVYVGVTSPEPGKLGHTPAEYGETLKEFAAAQAQTHGLRAEAQVIVANDPRCISLMQRFISENATLWSEDIAEET